MEKFIVIGIGIAALSYLAYVVWCSANGKSKCACGGTCTSKNPEKSNVCCCGTSKTLPK